MESLIGDSTYVSSIHYDYMGRITQLVRGAAVLTTDYSYYPWDTQGGRLQSLETSNSTSTLQDLGYSYDNVGNITEVYDAVNSETPEYTYDMLNRLVEFYINSVLTETYSFDSQGRLSSKGGETFAYGDSSHVHAATSMGDNSYTYDENGNMVIRSLVSGPVTGTYTLTHNADNRLVGQRATKVATTWAEGGGTLWLAPGPIEWWRGEEGGDRHAGQVPVTGAGRVSSLKVGTNVPKYIVYLTLSEFMEPVYC